MKYIFSFLMLAGATAAQAQEQQVGVETSIEVYANIRVVSYLLSQDGAKGTATPGQAWEGTRIFKTKDKCRQVSHTNLKIVKIGNVESAEYTEVVAEVVCPL